MPLGIDFTQIFLHMFNVVLLFGGLYFILYAPVKKIMQDRENHYKEMDESAKNKLAEAEQKNAEYEEKLKNVEAEISKQKKKASLDIANMRSNAEAEARDAAGKILEDAKRDAENQRKAIVASAKKDITEMVEEATRKVVLTSNTSEAYDMFLDNAERS
ncbi:ATP synthase F0 subcomplex B subunit [Lachnospiraceae bacterium]|nr:ATP synthase F0 subcomplex B subunit [Lachnospiraceae bacterium]